MKKLFYFLFMGWFPFACKAPKESPTSFYLDKIFFISIKNNQGLDLLSPLTPNAYLEKEIQVHYHRQTKATQSTDNPNTNQNKYFKLLSPEDTKTANYLLEINPNSLPPYPSITYINWNKKETDTLKCDYRSANNLLVCSQVWYNGVLVWDEKENTASRVIELTK